MPIPAPKKNETEDKFVTRCMSSDVMMREFPKNKQRFAVCMGKWRDKNKEGESSIDQEEFNKILNAFFEKHPELLKGEDTNA